MCVAFGSPPECYRIYWMRGWRDEEGAPCTVKSRTASSATITSFHIAMQCRSLPRVTITITTL
jgi:hypothetical protein